MHEEGDFEWSPIANTNLAQHKNSFSVTCVRCLTLELKIKGLPPEFINFLHNDSFPQQFHELCRD
jgi:hypothetical protein